MRVLEALEPQNVFYYFEEISKIPHGSRNSKGISDYLEQFGKEHQCRVYRDAADNIVMIAEATPGYEDHDPVIIQGHMDMVCEKEADCEIDFEKEGLRLYVDGDFVRARGTTLGGDDGIAIAYALALIDSNTVQHPQLEVVITTDEEIGMLGAQALDLSMLKGHRMLNIDSDVEGEFLVSCAGGTCMNIEIPVKRTRMRGRKIAVKVDGLQGGHSGSEIDRERGNADILMGRILREISYVTPFGILSLAGGLKDNAIPRECEVQLLIPNETIAVSDLQEDSGTDPDSNAGYTAFALVEELVEKLEQKIREELQFSDPKVRVRVTDLSGETSCEENILDYSSTGKTVYFLRLVPNGVMHRSIQMKDMVETSLNLGILELQEDCLRAQISIRSSVESRKADLCDRVCQIVEMVGGEAEIESAYPAWEYRAQSSLQELIAEVYQESTGEVPTFGAIHAGVECGILVKKIKDLDCVSFGPNNFDIHTPKERLSITSTAKYWEFLVELLRRM